jgi:hypothetical protein
VVLFEEAIEGTLGHGGDGATGRMLDGGQRADDIGALMDVINDGRLCARAKHTTLGGADSGCQQLLGACRFPAMIHSAQKTLLLLGLCRGGALGMDFTGLLIDDGAALALPLDGVWHLSLLY